MTNHQTPASGQGKEGLTMKFQKPNKIITLKEMQRMNKVELISHIHKFERLSYEGIYLSKSTLMDILNFNLNRYLFAFYY